MKYRGSGFWSWDGYLEHVLALLADRIGSSPKDDWLAELRDHWNLQSSGVFSGWIHPKLNEFLARDERRERVLALLGDVISQPTLTREAEQTARLMEALLQGKLNTDASSPLDYMVKGPHPYKWSVKTRNSLTD